MSASPDGPVRIVVVDDSLFIRRALARMLDEESLIDVVGTAASGEALIANLDEWAPAVVTLDLEMPGMGGLATLDHIREHAPQVAVIILSTHSGAGAPQTIEALHRGAVDFIDKQRYSLVDFASLRQILTSKIFEVCDLDPGPPPTPTFPPIEDSSSEIPNLSGWAGRKSEPLSSSRYSVVAVAASTGGPPALQRLLEDLGDEVDASILVVQHMPVGFTGAFAERLNAHLPLEVREAAEGDRLKPGAVLIAQGGMHMRVRRDQDGPFLSLTDRPRESIHTPSADVLFRSVARCVGRRAIGVVLTGMGSDGALGLARLQDFGGRTLVQDEASSVVYGMPRAALALDVVDEVVPINAMGTRLRALLAKTDDSSPFRVLGRNRRDNL